MAEKPQNKYCRNANIAEKPFLRILWYYLQGAPAAYAESVIIKEIGEAETPSDKTITTYYRRIGEWLFDNTLEPYLHHLQPKLKVMKQTDPDYYVVAAEKMCNDMVKVYLNLVDYDTFKQLDKNSEVPDIHTAIAIQLRVLSGAKKGIARSSKEHLALAYFQMVIRKQFAPPDGYIWSWTLHDIVKGLMEKNPL